MFLALPLLRSIHVELCAVHGDRPLVANAKYVMPENLRAGAEPRPAKAKYPAWYATALKLYKKPLDVDTDAEFNLAQGEFSDLSAGERGFFLVHMAFLGLQGLWMVVRLLMECRDGLEEIAELLERGLPNLVGPVDTVAGDDDDQDLPPEPDEAPVAKAGEVIPLSDGVDLIVPEGT